MLVGIRGLRGGRCRAPGWRYRTDDSGHDSLKGFQCVACFSRRGIRGKWIMAACGGPPAGEPNSWSQKKEQEPRQPFAAYALRRTRREPAARAAEKS